MKLKSAVVGLAALGALAAGAGTAMAMPNGLPASNQISSQVSGVDQVRYVCNAWGRCWWRPNHYYPRLYVLLKRLPRRASRNLTALSRARGGQIQTSGSICAQRRPSL